MKRTHQKAFTITQVIITIGLMAILSFAVTALMQNLRKDVSRIDTKSNLLQLRNRMQVALNNRGVLINTINNAANPNMACLKTVVNCTSSTCATANQCATTYVASNYSPSLDRIALYGGTVVSSSTSFVDNVTAAGGLVYDGRSTNTSGFTLNGAPCNGFSYNSATGNDACPIGYIISWSIEDSGNTSGTTVNLYAKMVFNPSNNSSLKRTYNQLATDASMGRYDARSSHKFDSLVNTTVQSCTLGGETIPVGSSKLFYKTASATGGNRCISEERVCLLEGASATPTLSGTATFTSCSQDCYGTWGTCNPSTDVNADGQICGPGEGVQNYNLVVLAEGGGNSSCPAQGAQQACNPVACPPNVNCVGSWSACSSSCGTGVRIYSITTQKSGTGTACPYFDGALDSCSSAACSGPVACEGSWGGWSGCAGGLQSRTYTVTQAAANGGAQCPYPNGYVESRGCGAPQNCEGSWSGWGSCSVACGSGTQTRRFVVNKPAINGGAACAYADGTLDSQACNTFNCSTFCNGQPMPQTVGAPNSCGGGTPYMCIAPYWFCASFGGGPLSWNWEPPLCDIEPCHTVVNRPACGADNQTAITTTPTALCRVGTAINLSGSAPGPWYWQCQGSPAPDAGIVGCNTRVNGTCGTANGGSFGSPPTTNLCSSGYSSSISKAGTTYSWTCVGSAGGSVANCSATAVTVGTCSSPDHLADISYAPSSLCSDGTASAVSGSNPWTWSCTGSGGGGNASCYTKVVPVCGSSNNASFASAPSTNLCVRGTASAVTTNATNYTWTCTGANPTANASCSAFRQYDGVCAAVSAINCNTNPAGKCSAGDVETPVCSSSACAWRCMGANGGAVVLCNCTK